MKLILLIFEKKKIGSILIAILKGQNKKKIKKTLN